MHSDICDCKKCGCGEKEKEMVKCEICGKESPYANSDSLDTESPQAKGISTLNWEGIGFYTTKYSEKFPNNLFIPPNDYLSDKLRGKKRICDKCLFKQVKKGFLENIGDPLPPLPLEEKNKN